MLKPTRPMPRVGARASISHFGGRAEQAVIVAIRDEGRSLVVRDEGRELREFTLRRATAAFVLVGEQHSPRLELK
ncbi:MAG: hypothetical protein NVSMB51_09230 [Solirubrobacteraceae bacterium]